MEQSTKSMQSLQRAFELLELLSDHPLGMTLTDLAQQSGLSKSTVHRFLASLKDIGYATQDSGSGQYRMTLRMFEIGSRSLRALNILELARPYLNELLELSGETVHLITVDNDEVLYIYKNSYASGVPLTIGSLIGNTAPMYCTGVGKAILAYLPEADFRRIWGKAPIVRFTQNTITDEADMRAELNRIRARGYAEDNEEHEPGISCIAVPIFDFAGMPKYAMSITSPTVRLDAARRTTYVAQLQRAARSISELLGFHPSIIRIRIPNATDPI